MTLAEFGQKDAMFSVEKALYYGLGTKEDAGRGWEWIQQAAQAGLQEALQWEP